MKLLIITIFERVSTIKQHQYTYSLIPSKIGWNKQIFTRDYNWKIKDLFLGLGGWYIINSEMDIPNHQRKQWTFTGKPHNNSPTEKSPNDTVNSNTANVFLIKIKFNIYVNLLVAYRLTNLYDWKTLGGRTTDCSWIRQYSTFSEILFPIIPNWWVNLHL